MFLAKLLFQFYICLYIIYVCMVDCDAKCYFLDQKLHITVVKLYWQIRTQINVNPWSGKISHCLSYWACALELIHALQQEKPLQREASTLQLQSSPYSSQRKPTCNKEDPLQPPPPKKRKKDPSELSHCLSTMWGYNEKWTVCKLEEGLTGGLDHTGSMISDFQTSELWEINFCCPWVIPSMIFCRVAWTN